MKKIFILCLLSVFVLGGVCYAADKARAGTFGQSGISQVDGIADVSDGNCVDVTEKGAMPSVNRSRAVTSGLGDTLLYTGACYVQSISISGVSAGDSCAIYDGITAGTYGTAKFDPKTDTANGSSFVDCKGAPFSTGIYADCTDTDVFVSVVYDY